MSRGAQKVIDTKRKQSRGAKMPEKKPAPPRRQRGEEAQAEHDRQRAAVRGDKLTPLTFTDEASPGAEWLSTTTPAGEIAPARIRKSSKNSDGSYSFFCYRNAEAVAVVHDLEAAKRACQRGKRPELSDAVLNYVTDHPLEIPPFLALSEGERRAVRAQYGYAAPPATRVMARLERGSGGQRGDAGDDSDAGTRRLREELAREGSGVAGRRARAAEGAAPRPKKAALVTAEGRLVRADKPGNPKKAGTGAHGRWERLFAACGGTVAAYRDAGGNMETLANAVAKGYVRIEEVKK